MILATSAEAVMKTVKILHIAEVVYRLSEHIRTS